MTLPDRLTAFLDNNFDRYLEALRQWLAIKSVSTLPEHRQDVIDAAEWAVRQLQEIGFPEARLENTAGHPLVVATWQVDDQQPTLLIYGHYDVQPVDPLEQWLSPPFAGTIRDGAIYGRGASDDKGQIVLVLAALAAWADTSGGPPINIKVLLEGEEEAGGESVAAFVPDHLEMLAADAVLICDTQMISAEQPSLITGLRGILCAELVVRGAKTDLHSGAYGGVAPNPLHALCLLLARLKGEDGHINIPQLAARIPEPTRQEKDFWREDPLGITANLLGEMGVTEMVGENDYPPLERVGLRPTLEIHGICGGFTGAGTKTVIPAEALAKISMRLPAGMPPDEVFAWLEEAARSLLPRGYDLEVRNLHGGKGVAMTPDHPIIRAAAEAVETTYRRKPVFLREGGSIPLAAQLHEVLHVPIVLLGFGLPDDGVHAPNEHFRLDQFRRGMQTVADFLGRLRRR